jgi:hypothetical protein
MRRFCLALLLPAVLCSAALLPGSRAEVNSLKGDYVEARTASVFAGACHFNGELTTTGRDALMAWRVTAGSWNGVDLTGVRALAIVGADQNLYDIQAARRSELIIEQSASPAQMSAMTEAVKSMYAATLGRVVSVRSAPIQFKRESKTYSVNSPNSVTMNVEAMPDDLCCRMPHLVWYEPLVPLANRKVGHTIKASYAGGKVGDRWQRDGENSAFYGSFSF